MTLFLVVLFFGALALTALPEIFYDRRPPRLARPAPPQARQTIVIRDPDLAQWMTHQPDDAA